MAGEGLSDGLEAEDFRDGLAAEFAEGGDVESDDVAGFARSEFGEGVVTAECLDSGRVNREITEKDPLVRKGRLFQPSEIVSIARTMHGSQRNPDEIRTLVGQLCKDIGLGIRGGKKGQRIKATVEGILRGEEI